MGAEDHLINFCGSVGGDCIKIVYEGVAGYFVFPFVVPKTRLIYKCSCLFFSFFCFFLFFCLGYTAMRGLCISSQTLSFSVSAFALLSLACISRKAQKGHL